MSSGLRWWDGADWSGYTAWPRHPAIALERKERSVLPWAKGYAIAVGIAAVLGATVGGSVLTSFHHFFHAYDHWIHASVTAANAGQQAPKPPSYPFSGGILVLDLVELPVVGLAVVFYVWLYRAACAARSLGYPASRSPGWSVAVWLLPVVTLWMPAQSLRSLLPPGHPARARVWPAWCGYLAATGLLWIGLGISFFGSGGAVTWVLVGAGDVALVGAGYLLFRYIGIVGDQHRETVEAMK